MYTILDFVLCRPRNQFLKKMVLRQSKGFVSSKILTRKKIWISKIFASKRVRSWNQKKSQNTVCPHFSEKKFCATIKILTNCITYPKFREHFFDLGQKIGKIRYHDFQNRHFCNLGCIFEIKMMMKICLGVFRFQIRILFEKNLWIFFFSIFSFKKSSDLKSDYI